MPKHPIHIIVLTLLITVFIAFPLVKIPISVSARGVVRSAFEDTQITASVGGRVMQNNIAFCLLHTHFLKKLVKSFLG